MSRLPMFPLEHPLLPGAQLDLHVFEFRYRQMVRDLLNGGRSPEFGVVLIDRGSEVGIGQTRRDIGCLATIERADRHSDGRFSVVARGVHRISVVEWLDGKPYPYALIAPLVDLPGEPISADVLSVLEQRVRGLNALARQLKQAVTRLRNFDGLDQAGVVYTLADASPLGPADRQRLLEAPSLSARLDVLNSALDDVHAALEFHRS